MIEKTKTASVSERLTQLEADVKQLKALVAARPIIPNDETTAAMEAARRGEFTGSFNTVAELMTHLHSRVPRADD